MPPHPDEQPQQSADLSLTYYPAYCYRASPTWFAWIQLTCFELHNILKPGPAHAQTYTSGNASHTVLFYLNHPIQYVQLIGIVVAIEEYNEHFFLITLDDSSGCTVDVVLRKPKATPDPPSSAKNAAIASSPDPTELEELAETLTLLAQLDRLQIGSSVRVKGTISTFRSRRQLNLLRMDRLVDTNAEMRLVAARTAFHAKVLSRPWRLRSKKKAELLSLEQGDKVVQSKDRVEQQAKRREWKKKLEDREKQHEKAIVDEWEVEEIKREKAAKRAQRDGVRSMERRRGKD